MLLLLVMCLFHNVMICMLFFISFDIILDKRHFQYSYDSCKKLPEIYLAAAVAFVAVALAAVPAELVVVGTFLSLFVADFAKWIAATWLEAELSTWSSCWVIRT